MKDSGKQVSAWSRGRWALVISVFFLAQVLLILSERTSKKAIQPELQPTYHLFSHPITSSQIARTFFASDPTLYSAASLHSFSGPAWLRLAASTNRFPDHAKPTNWLSLDASQLGCLAELREVAKSVDFQSEERAGPTVYLPSLDLEPAVQTQSVVRIEGDLASRAVDVPAPWPPWPIKDNVLLKKTEVQLAVNRAGVVLSTRLLQEGRSRSFDADYEALEIARQLHFAPAGDASEITRGKLVIEWKTVLPAESSAVSPKNM